MVLRCAGEQAALDQAVPIAIGRQRGQGETCRSVGPFVDDTLCEAVLLAPDAAPVLCRAPGWESVEATPGESQSWQGGVSLSPTELLVPAVTETWTGRVVAVGADGTQAASAGVSNEVPDFLLPVHVPAGDPPTRSLATSTVVRSPEGGVTFISVSPGQVGAMPWTIPLPEGDALDEGTSAEAAGAHIVAVLAAGVVRLEAEVATLTFESPPSSDAWLQVRWAPGRAAPCGTCFEPDGFGTIELSGRPGDPDAWDDAVILHELGHWALRRYGRDDSPGGAHDGSRVAGSIAYSEGFADFHAAWQQGDPALLDRRADGPRVRDLDAMSEEDPLARGTSDATGMGLVSERLVSALLWDLLDAGEADDDPAALPATQMFDAALATAAAWRVDRGPVGFDLTDYLDALACVDEEAGETAAALARSRGFGYETPEMPSCPVRSGE
jgi:hypothetical protein